MGFEEKYESCANFISRFKESGRIKEKSLKFTVKAQICPNNFPLISVCLISDLAHKLRFT